MQSSAPAEAKGPTATASQPANTSRTKELAGRILERFPAAKIDYVRPKRVKVTVSPEAIKEAAIFVRDQLGFGHIGTVAGTDYIQQNEMEVVYFVGSVSTPGQEDLKVCLAERVKRDALVVPSLVDVWTGADYHERETYEMLGITFQGHPD